MFGNIFPRVIMEIYSNMCESILEYAGRYISMSVKIYFNERKDISIYTIYYILYILYIV